VCLGRLLEQLARQLDPCVSTEALEAEHPEHAAARLGAIAEDGESTVLLMASPGIAARDRCGATRDRGPRRSRRSPPVPIPLSAKLTETRRFGLTLPVQVGIRSANLAAGIRRGSSDRWPRALSGSLTDHSVPAISGVVFS
jgi:hypothetical protein